MSAISYITSEPNLEKVSAGTAAPTSGRVEVRIDTTSNAVTDSNSPTGTRALKRGEIQAMLRTIEQMVLKDPAIPQ